MVLRFPAQSTQSIAARTASASHKSCHREPFVDKQQHSGNAANMSDKKQTVDLGLLEEDDEFEEFPAEDWTGLDEDEDAHVWEDNWDDDNVEDDFSNQLRAELEKHGYKMETS
ncbi:hypothetical protein PFLUV_G00154470 [Perca fluviatilis]|uniref:26S proteasome complex subunit SEM1 n=1 Tax=Perca fluviatilis TaxID=8168 RepID=A0A6A5EGC0_PERFL|nr:hypothetical protein PFLUV_G00154470 [Perca fluviatilis]